jgi:hypothetical protein
MLAFRGDRKAIMTLAPNPGFPEKGATNYEAKYAENGVRRGPLRFEEGIATDTDVPNEFTKGAMQGYITAPGRSNHIAPFAGEIVNVTAVVGTAPTGAAAIFDIEKEGVTIFTTTANRPTIPIAGTESPVSARPDVTSFVAGDTFALRVSQIGSTVAGSDADVTLQFTVN